jgi:hypothetical protein
MKVLAVLFREFDHDCFEFRIGCLLGEIEDAVASPLNSAPRISEIVHGIRGFLAVTIFHDFFLKTTWITVKGHYLHGTRRKAGILQFAIVAWE